MNVLSPFSALSSFGVDWDNLVCKIKNKKEEIPDFLTVLDQGRGG